MLASPLTTGRLPCLLLGMSLLSSYEGLRQEIQRLAQENEELRRLVQLIQENQELKLVLRSRGSSLGFCSSSFVAEVTANPWLSRRKTIKFKDAERGEPRASFRVLSSCVCPNGKKSCKNLALLSGTASSLLGAGGRKSEVDPAQGRGGMNSWKSMQERGCNTSEKVTSSCAE